MSGLVLTARSDEKGALGTLSVDLNKQALGQGWAAGGDNALAGPTLARIEWLPGRCLNMMSSDDRVVLGVCDEGFGVANKWDIHWHRSIKNGLNKWGCLSCKDPYGRRAHCEYGSDIVVQRCCLGLPSQRWEITGGGGIRNTETGLYLTVVNSGNRVIAAPRGDERGLNQSWVFKMLDG
ncbi:hypothetical protein Tsubulata_033110 [Turnera subulata]|uniref:Ricin B lectin domain-containing protein n=1 Tax=Turnera subulata TaxID=218843 RepID=A0A9Q0FCD5_9ROSI|nr:hypothetical protein Tsubulata_033110 [Turnera subulata]